MKTFLNNLAILFTSILVEAVSRVFAIVRHREGVHLGITVVAGRHVVRIPTRQGIDQTL